LAAYLDIKASMIITTMVSATIFRDILVGLLPCIPDDKLCFNQCLSSKPNDYYDNAVIDAFVHPWLIVTLLQ